MLRRLDPNGIGHSRAPQRSFGNVAGSAVDGLTICEGVAIRGGYRAHVMRIHVIEVAAVGVEDVRVANKRIVDVDVPDVSATAVVPWEKRFTKSQREPAHSKSEPAAEETDKRRAINCATVIRTGAPSPPSAKIVPTTIVVRSKAPRFVANPSPAPRADVVP